MAARWSSATFPDTCGHDDDRRRRGTGNPPQPAGDRPRLALPGDLAGSLRHLDDTQLDTLLRAANAEAERRGRKTPRAGLPGPPRAGSRKRKAAALTPGQEKIVRAALAAGVGPAAIARQFRIPRAQVLHIAAAAKRGG